MMELGKIMLYTEEENTFGKTAENSKVIGKITTWMETEYINGQMVEYTKVNI